jgi:putative phage-type endonuclease
MDRESFLEERKSGIGGSDAASLFGVGYGCRRRLWYDKSGVAPDFEREESAPMELGTILEPYFAEKYEERTGRRVTRDSCVLRHPQHPELLVHVDGLINYDAAKGSGILEIKSVGRAVFYKVKREGLPEDYILQLNHGMLIADAQWGSFAVGSRDSGDLMYWDVERDQEICDLILKEGPRFWRTLDSTDAMPNRLEPDDPRCQKCAWRVSCQGEHLIHIAERSGEQIEEDESLRPLRQEYLERKALSDEAEALLDETKEELKSKLGERSAVKVGGRPIYFRAQTAMRWDGSELAGYCETLRSRLRAALPASTATEFLSAYPPAETFKKAVTSRPLRVYG